MEGRAASRLLAVAAIAVLVGSMGPGAAFGQPGIEGGAPSVVSYQGQVVVSGSPYTGVGYFKFAIVSGDGATSFWSNDGTSAGGSEPTNAVQLSVSQGLFNLLLGDTTLGGMSQALPASVFSGTDRYIRVWFGTSGSELQRLAPDRRIAAVPYALQAQEAVNADTLDGAHGSAYQARVGGACALGSTVRAVNADGSVVCEAHDARPVFSCAAADSSFAVGTYSSITIGADGLPVISYLQGYDFDLRVLKCGNLACTAGNTLAAVDTAGLVGSYTSIAIGADGLPVVSYYDQTNYDLKVSHCGDAACTAGNTVTTVDSTGNVGIYSSITIGADALPVVSYQDQAQFDLKVLHCGNAACTSGNAIAAPDTGGSVGYWTSIAIGIDGLPVVSYTNAWQDLKVLKCGDPACASGNTVTTVDATVDVGYPTSIAVGADGLPVIAYHDNTNYDLRVAHCADAACSAGTTITTVDSAGTVGQFASLTIGSDGLPVISYYDATGVDLKLVHCGNAGCTAGNAIWTLDSAGNVGEWTAITVGTDGLPLVSYSDNTNTDLKVAHCSNLACVPYWRPR